MNGVSELKRDVVSACRILCEQKLVEGFGHVSARLPDSESFLLTPRISLAIVEEADLLTLNFDGKVAEGHNPVPFEQAERGIGEARIQCRQLARYRLVDPHFIDHLVTPFLCVLSRFMLISICR